MPESIKDQIADSLRSEGFDFMSAYEEASRVIKEFVASGKPEATYTTKSGTKIVLAKKQPTTKGN
jgi:hypothetical protein